MSERPESHEDRVARLLAQGDQFAAGVQDLARQLGQVRDAFCAAGFTREEALHLVTIVYTITLNHAFGHGEPE
ncbi:MAG: hypothetical protein ACRDM7_22775 [Thermoleophilaceae bacterium]